MKIAKLSQSGQNQFLYLPEEFRFKGEGVYIKKSGNCVVLIPIENPWKTLFKSLDKFSKNFMKRREQPKHQSRDDIVF